MLAIGLMLFRDPLGSMPIYFIGLMLLLISAVLTLWSMCLYLFAAWPELRRDA
jgi:CDP-diacylglycerol--glycerol-3-phosphate 3-phosphatidyltransferase/cardiolipin synthase